MRDPQRQSDRRNPDAVPPPRQETLVDLARALRPRHALAYVLCPWLLLLDLPTPRR